jgi:methylthioribose-1-phosphate isomerase
MLMSQGKVDLVILGADRIAKNGDFANKIGTYSLAVLAHYHGVPFYTVAPITTFDFNINTGKEIPIEERDKNEVLGFREANSAPYGSDAYNPSFDVTPHKLLTGIITEYGIIYPPFKENIDRIVAPNLI